VSVEIRVFNYQRLFQATAALLSAKSHRLTVFNAGRSIAILLSRPGTVADYYWFAEKREEFLQHYVA